MKKERMREILNKFSEVKIAVIGDMMLDEYIIGSVDRISPEAPVPVVKVKEERFVLGGAANVLNNLSRLGARVKAYTVIGEDLSGDRLIKELKDNNIESSDIIRTTTRPTILKKRIIGGHQQLLRIDWEENQDIPQKYEEQIINKVEKEIENLDAIILSDYNKGVLTPMVSKKIIELARKNNKILIVDPKPENVHNYIGATSMTPNRKEAMECLNLDKIEDIYKLGKKLKEKLKLDNLLLTRSEEGLSLFEEKITDISTYAKEVFDVTGAGDTVIATYTLVAATGASWIEAAEIANIAAGIVVGKIGTATVSKEEIIDNIKN
ncbi:MAG: D-glycero-beta-D-manno-heptose-7-phosphate kinase [Cetobacterium sp.]